MNLLKKIFKTTASPTEKVSPFMPDENNLPLDELFTSLFIENGGKFLYCSDMTEVQTQFENILEENDWFEKKVFCLESDLYGLLKENKLKYKNVKSPIFLFSGCENLIADEGSVMVSSTQIGQNRPHELPSNMIIFATTKQIVSNKSEGLQKIRTRYKTNYPTNITTFKYFEKLKTENFMTYGSVQKNLYLILLESD